MKLRVAHDLVLTDDFVTSTSAILGKKRVGKSYFAQVLAEELLAARQHVVVLDLTSAWWGLRSSADGQSPGYPITIFGGRHGDLPLEPTAGAELAEAIVDERFSAVLDVRLLKKGQRLRFIADFLETLYDKNTTAMHLFMDEADSYVPQRTFSPEQARALGAADELVRRGGIGGIGVTMVSQRAQVINKDVLSQVDALTVLRMNHPKDLGAIRDWVAAHVDADRAREMLASLPALPRGEAWYWAPEAGTFRHVGVRSKRTFDSGRTPKPGERVAPPKVLAGVDLARLGAKMAAAVLRQRENDPRELKKQVADLRAKNLALGEQVAGLQAKAKEEPPRNEGPRVEDQRRLGGLVKKIEGLVRGITGTHVDLERYLGGLRVEATKLSDAAAVVARVSSRMSGGSTLGGVSSSGAAAESRGVGEELKPAHLRILSAIAWWESGGVATPDLGGVAFVAGTTVKSSAFDNNRARLHVAGYIDYPSRGCVRLTLQGRVRAPAAGIPPTNAALHEVILQKISPAHGRLLRALIGAYPVELALEEFARQAGTSVTSSAFDNNRSWLKARGLVEYPRAGFVRAAALLFPGSV